MLGKEGINMWTVKKEILVAVFLLKKKEGNKYKDQIYQEKIDKIASS